MGITFNKKSKLKERVANVTLTEYDFAKEKNLIIEDLLFHNTYDNLFY